MPGLIQGLGEIIFMLNADNNQQLLRGSERIKIPPSSTVQSVEGGGVVVTFCLSLVDRPLFWGMRG